MFKSLSNDHHHHILFAIITLYDENKNKRQLNNETAGYQKKDRRLLKL